MANRSGHTKLYHQNHHHVSKARGPAKNQACEHCGGRAEDWATITGLDSETEHVDPWAGFIALCKKCHWAYDKRDKPPWWRGKRHRPESIEKIRQAKLGISNHTPASRKMISDALRGTPKPPETRERMRQAQQMRRAAEDPAERRTWQHGTTSGYRRGCRCDPCTDARNAYRRAAYHAGKRS